ncbi:DEAD/DEAH box helicase, partial [Streptomyces sp. URMC 124]
RQFALGVEDWTDIAPVRDEAEPNPLANMSFDEYMDEVRRRLKEVLPQYESRDAQDIMFQEVMQALDEDKHLLIEAGTGTGKSLGYLLPSIYQSVKQEQKVMVSTHTINLQEQLRDRDIPLLTQVVPF